MQHLDRAHAHDLVAVFGADLEDREHQLLLAQRRGALDAELLGHGDQFGGGFLLQVFEMHVDGLFLGIGTNRALRKARMRQDAASRERAPADGKLADEAV